MLVQMLVSGAAEGEVVDGASAPPDIGAHARATPAKHDISDPRSMWTFSGSRSLVFLRSLNNFIVSSFWCTS